MKVGALFRVLSLLLVLPSATVLSLAGSIDGTMKTGTALLLLISLHSVEVSTEPSTVDRCRDSMICFADESCKPNESDEKLVEFSGTAPIKDDCKAILKLRPYSANKYRVVLESRNTEVNEIIVKRKSTSEINIFSCKKISNGEVEPKYKDKVQEPIMSTVSPLMCEFIAEDSTNEIFSTSSQSEIMITTNDESMGPKSAENLLTSHILPPRYCNPADGIDDSSTDEAFWFVRPTIGLTDLSCKAPFTLETRIMKGAKREPAFVKTESVNCVKPSQKFTIKRDGEILYDTFDIRCTVKLCTQCDFIPGVSGGPAPEIITASDGCKELKCATGQLKVGDSMGVATCKKIDGNPAWDLKGKKIDKATTVVCENKVECPAASTVCGEVNCKEGSNGLTCPSGDQMTLNSKQVTISCNFVTGKWEYIEEGGTASPLPENQKFSCPSKDTANQKSPDGASTTTIACIVAGVCIAIAVIFAFACVFYRKRNAQNKNEKTRNSTEPYSVPPTTKSKEETKKEPELCMGIDLSAQPKQSTVAPPPQATPTQAPPLQAPPPSNPMSTSSAKRGDRGDESNGDRPTEVTQQASPAGDQTEITKTDARLGIPMEKKVKGMAAYGPSPTGRIPNHDRQTNKGVTPDTTGNQGADATGATEGGRLVDHRGQVIGESTGRR